jgi:hypothetical protein
MKNNEVEKIANVDVVKLLGFIMSGISDKAKCIDGMTSKFVSGNYEFLFEL